jgi:hypothetical protein
MIGVFSLLGGALIGCYLFGSFVLGVYFWSEDWKIPQWVLVCLEKRKYLRSLSPEDRRAYLYHERRKKDHHELKNLIEIETARRCKAFYDKTGKDPNTAPGQFNTIWSEVHAEWNYPLRGWEDVTQAPDF